MKKILLSILTVGVVGAVAYLGYTGAFFSDTETSKDNRFQAGALDLRVDSEAHYNGLVCRLDGAVAPVYRWLEPVGTPPGPGLDALKAQEHYDTTCNGTWIETDLGAKNKFFDLVDVKPGDEGEDTISLHVYDSDAWGRFLINDVTDLDETCTEPESEVGAEEPECPVPNNTPATTPGELAKNMTFYAWLDQGVEEPGFQNIGPDGNPFDVDERDVTEGDNVWQCEGQVGDTVRQLTLDEYRQFFNPTLCKEPLVILPGNVDNDGGNPDPDETHNIWLALKAADALYCEKTSGDYPDNGHNNYGECHGIADDGRMVGSTTYYFGLAWSIPDGVGNEAQTDSLSADLSFEAEQWRNNPTPFEL